jgi:hypothetical protein
MHEDAMPVLPLLGAGLEVSESGEHAVAALRYFSREGEFARAVAAAAGSALPQPLEAREMGALILAWRSPTETVCVARSAQELASLAARTRHARDGCCVELTCGLRVVRVRGARIAELLCRLGNSAYAPQPGEARRSRMADVPVLALSVRPAEVLLLIDGALLPHLLAWVRATLADLDSP